MKYIPNAMKFGNQSRSSSLMINMIFEIADLEPKLKTWADLVSKLQSAWFFFFFFFFFCDIFLFFLDNNL